MNSTAIELPEDHPGTSDSRYLERRAVIAAASAAGGQPDDDPPIIEYTPAEDSVWQTVSTALAELHEQFAIDEYLVGAAALQLPTDRVPQLADVSRRLDSLTGWRVRAVPGLVPTRDFYGSLAGRRFLSTQYIRHASVPFYTPEPDVIHELVGHVNALACSRMAALYAAAGEASRRAVSEATLERFSRVFWFTLEFGVVHQRGELRTYGAGLLSSFGEIQRFRTAQIRPFDIESMATFDYDITRFQDVLFAADSFDQVEAELGGFFAGIS